MNPTLGIDDLIQNPLFRFDEAGVRSAVAGKTVLITGAGGSIGAMLCRHIAKLQPARVVAVDRSESALFELQMEIADQCNLDLRLELFDILNETRVNDAISHHRPAIVFHAAAYKHVPMMETRPFEAVENNLLGTRAVALASQAAGAQIFVLISTDKAVAPVSVMGATKRLAERLIAEMSTSPTTFVAVRLGNVLGSSGSVVPIFERQIARGGPVTVTHPDMQRLFMTPAEACRVALQSLVSARAGEVCFAMPAPLRIVDLAQMLIRRAGLTSDSVAIQFTGIRPGEKLVEAISDPSERIRIDIATGLHLVGRPQDASSVIGALDRFREVCESRQRPRLLALFTELLPEYKPSSSFLAEASGAVPASG